MSQVRKTCCVCGCIIQHLMLLLHCCNMNFWNFLFLLSSVHIRGKMALSYIFICVCVCMYIDVPYILHSMQCNIRSLLLHFRSCCSQFHQSLKFFMALWLLLTVVSERDISLWWSIFYKLRWLWGLSIIYVVCYEVLLEIQWGWFLITYTNAV